MFKTLKVAAKVTFISLQFVYVAKTTLDWWELVDEQAVDWHNDFQNWKNRH